MLPKPHAVAATVAPLSLAAALAVLLAACLPDEDAGSRDVADVGKSAIKLQESQNERSIYGSYLAGRFAEGESDLTFAANMMERVLEENPDDTGILRRTFILQLGAGNGKRAAELAQRLQDAGSKLTSSTLLLVGRDLTAGKHDAALARLDTLPKSGLGRFAKPLATAWVLAGKKDTDGALKALEPLAQEKGFEAMHGLHAGLIEELAGRLEAAEARYRKLGENGKESSSRVGRVMASLLQRQGKKDEAAKVIATQLEQNPQSMVLAEDRERLKSGKPLPRMVSTAAEGLAEGLFNIASALPRDRAENVVLLYGRIALELSPEFPLAKLLVSDVLVSRERYADAIKVYSTLDPKTPYGWSARLRIADAQYELKQVDAAAKLLETMAKERPERVDALLKLGNFYRYKERFKDAVKAYDRAFERIGTPQKQHWTLYYSRGIALERSKQWDRAEKDFLQALEFEPEQPYVLNYLGYSWVEQGKNIDRARKMIERAVKQRKNDGYIVDSMGWVLYRLGQYDEAVTQLERAVQLRPLDPVINDHLGDAYWQVGRRHEARFQWRRALSFKPTDEDKVKIEGKLENGLETPKPVVKSETGG